MLLHRVKIEIPKSIVKCPIKCERVENCYRCNDYYKKCSIYIRKIYLINNKNS
jgi:hypothetical protein